MIVCSLLVVRCSVFVVWCVLCVMPLFVVRCVWLVGCGLLVGV